MKAVVTNGQQQAVPNPARAGFVAEPYRQFQFELMHICAIKINLNFFLQSIVKQSFTKIVERKLQRILAQIQALPATLTSDSTNIYRQKNMKSVSPNIFVTDINATIEFYKQLGFSLTTTVPEESDNIIFAMMTCGNVTFMFQTFESLGNELPTVSRQNGGSLLLYIQTNEIRKFFDQIKDKVNVIKELEKTFYGATEFSIEDNNGYLLTFAEDED